MKLKEIFNKIGHFGKDVGCNDKGSTHSYIETYERILEPFQKGVDLLEIGLALGDSIKLWDEYFENSNITGVDISLMFNYDSKKNNIELIEADATKYTFLDYIKNKTFDIIIDDGEHTHQSQVKTFNLLKGKVKKGGVYIIEDILNFDISKEYLLHLHDNVEVVDLRSVKGRFDDVLLIYRF